MSMHWKVFEKTKGEIIYFGYLCEEKVK